MRTLARPWVAIVFLCAAASGAQAQSLVTEQAARDFGRAADAAALDRIIRMGTPQLVRHYAAGLQISRIEVLPAEVEALVVEHFNDPRVGAELRNFEPRYRTRRLFDMHLERIRSTIRADEPSFRQILRTDQEGIDDALLQVAAKFPPSSDASDVVFLLARRRHPDAVPLLIAALEPSYQSRNAGLYQSRVTSALLAYPSVDVWRRASDEVERLNRESRITPEVYASARKHLDTTLDDPRLALDRLRSVDARAAFEAKRRAILPNEGQIGALRQADPRRYAGMQAEYLRKQDGIAAEIGDDGIAYEVGNEYFLLGMFVRFNLGDAKAAVPLLVKSALARHALGQVALADTYQLALRDGAAAQKAYATALAEASRPTQGQPFWPYAGSNNDMNHFWREWLAAETEFARSGRPFRGRISERAIAGFFEVTMVHAAMMRTYFPDIPGKEADSDDRVAFAASLAGVPASRFALFAGLGPISLLGRDDIARQLARHDPSGFWTACVMGAVLYYGAGGDRRRESAQRSGVADLLPGMAAAGKPNALRAAADRFMGARQLRVAAGKP